MEITISKQNGYAVIDLSGELDAAAVEKSRDTFEQVANDAEHGVVFDLSRVSFIDSSGVGALVFVFKRVTVRNLSMSMVGMTGQPKRLLELLRIHKTIRSYAALEDALPREEGVYALSGRSA